MRQPLGAEHDVLLTWVRRAFTPGWASEVRAGLAHQPPGVVLAVREGRLLGFCCWDATARGMLGPIGVATEARGVGVGAALVRAALAQMRSAGYLYAVVGWAGEPAFFERVAGAVPIADSTPGPYDGVLRG